MKKLHREWGDRVQFLEVMIQQAHPGPSVPPYRSLAQKQRDAWLYQQEESIPWPVLVDDVEGTTHQVYGGLADPTYLIDKNGRVAYYNMWTHAPNLHQALKALFAQGEQGVAGEGMDHVPYLASTLAHGWRGIRRGLPQSYLELELAFPGMGAGLWLGYRLRRVLEPLGIRSRPLPLPARAVVWAGLAALGVMGFQAVRRR
jgi:hypothetical protein